jgi:Ca2+-transporting ATPase
VIVVPAAHLVPGDVILMEAGAQVPADARLLRTVALSVDEAALTGESQPVLKDAGAQLDAGTPMAERSTMVFLGTLVTAGTGLAVVTATGAATELGRIGQLVALAGERTTPLERQVEGLGRRLIGVALGVCAAVGLVGILHGQSPRLMLETAITLAVAAIPEGLPAVISVALAAGLWRLARAGALVRRLPAVETLGCTTVICSDKTGTMTENRMVVTRVTVGERTVVVEHGAGAPPTFLEQGQRLRPGDDPRLVQLLTAATLANDASVERRGDVVRVHGEPTEAALLQVTLDAGLDPVALARRWARRDEIPFSPELRLMATLNETAAGESAVFAKGAPGAVLDRCSHTLVRNARVPLTETERTRLHEANASLASRGLRVLAIAWHPGSWAAAGRLADLTFLGFVGFEDPVRPGVKEAIARCAEAGIRTVMLTGDQRLTAEAVGQQLGLGPDAIRSRVSPEDKLDLIRDLQARGEIVAMTGDGVNDAPALARADIGIAMGRHGTDVAREAADLVLTDDNFATIVRAVEEGRAVYANLEKVIRFLFSANISEIATIFVAVVLGLPAPLLPLQILWVNLVTDTFPAMALIRDPAEPDVMGRPPRDPRRALLTWHLALRMLSEGVVLAAGVLSGYFWVVATEGVGARASTTAFMALVMIQPLQAMQCRSMSVPWWRRRWNAMIPLSFVVLALAQWCAVSWPPLARLLGTTPLSANEWLVVAVAITWPVLLLEGAKLWRR